MIRLIIPVSPGVIFVAHLCSCQVGKVVLSVTFLTADRNEFPAGFHSLKRQRRDRKMTENHVSGMEASAISVLKRAVELDQSGRFQESLVCYQEGIQLLMDVLKGLCLPPLDIYTLRGSLRKTWTITLVSFPLPSAVKDESKRGHYRDKIKGYMDRAEQIKAHVNQMKEGN